MLTGLHLQSRVSISRMEFGIELIAPVPGEVVKETIMFETPFNEIPHVFINTRSSTPQNVYATAGDIKTDRFTIYAYRDTKTDISVDWVAMGK